MPSDKKDCVSLTLSQYLHLLQAAKEYALLKSALYRGGITPETIDVLLTSEETTDLDHRSPAEPLQQMTNGLKDSHLDHCQPYRTIPDPLNDHITPEPPWASRPSPEDGHLPSTRVESWLGFAAIEEAEIHVDADCQPFYPYPENNKRTLYFSGLPPSSTLQNIVDVIRGGIVIDIQLVHDHARVTMLDSAQAEQYMRHVKRHDIYIGLKRVCCTRIALSLH